ncbi:MAG: acyl-CoA dehydrogenase [Alphaproteobacteria bacterium]|nr:acyl-CoA dehydrogenase [Alphaproteobacteria bacterium]
MTAYNAPLADMRFVLNELVDLDRLAALTGCGIDRGGLDHVLDEAGRFAAEVLAPLNGTGDAEGARLANGVVMTPNGFRKAYEAFVEGGWNGLSCPVELGGSALPRPVAMAVSEMWNAANMAWSLCPLLTQSGIGLLERHGNADQRRRYLRNLVHGTWTATMCLTEPQAGSDVGAVTTVAARRDGVYRLRGRKIFITYGDHDLAANVVHLVLARIEGATPGPRGLSLFIVPKVLVGTNGSLGAHNDLRVTRLERKLGIHGSPTCEMVFGEGEGAIAELVGNAGDGLPYMFTMMNNARLAVGLQGVAIAERAYQQARSYALERVQGRTPEGHPARLADHADVRRTLLIMRAEIEAIRGLAYVVAEQADLARLAEDQDERARALAVVDLLTPVVKAHATDVGFEIASRNLQIHGGAGYIEATGAAQHLRDIRIASIYEGTNGIQAQDLIRRKLAGQGGKTAQSFLALLAQSDTDLATVPELASLRQRLAEGVDALGGATRWMLATAARDMDSALAGASDYLRLFGLVAGGWVMATAAMRARYRLAAETAAPQDRGVYQAKLITARIYADRILPQAAALLGPATSGAVLLRAIGDEQL